MAQARALVEGRAFCVPDDIKQLVVPVWSHRVIPAGGSANGLDGGSQRGEEILREIVASVSVPI